jgi:hypothetical protein
VGGLLPLWKFRSVLRRDHAPRDEPAGDLPVTTMADGDDLNGTVVPPRPSGLRRRTR